MADEVYQVTARQLASKRNGQKGGQARAKSTTPEQRMAASEKGGFATRDKLGTGFLRYISSAEFRKTKAGR
jgi:general stress protein YciG